MIIHLTRLQIKACLRIRVGDHASTGAGSGSGAPRPAKKGLGAKKAAPVELAEAALMTIDAVEGVRSVSRFFLLMEQKVFTSSLPSLL